MNQKANKAAMKQSNGKMFSGSKLYHMNSRSGKLRDYKQERGRLREELAVSHNGVSYGFRSVFLGTPTATVTGRY